MTLLAAESRTKKKGCEARERQIGEQHEKEFQKQAEQSSDGICCRGDGQLALSPRSRGWRSPGMWLSGHPTPLAAHVS